jgi:class 3 adenylate cyclase
MVGFRHRRTERPSTHQEVKSMLFADIVGYSKLTEKVMADFVNVFMQRLSVLLSNSPNAPRSVNTWGDAIYAAFDYSLDAGLFALQLTKLVHDGAPDWKAKGLFHTAIDPDTGKPVEYPLSVRVGLHTGPVLAHYNPILREIGYTGSHVNRAARIEPIAKPGEVYASEEFAAMSELGKEIARRAGKQLSDAFVCEYAGSKALAKGYPGLFRIYRLIPEKNFAIEELAKEAHRLYLEQQAREGRPIGSAPALRPWEELAEDYKDANRAQVTDIPNKLYSLGYELAPSTGVSADEISPTPEEMEILARREHDRWMAERVRQGWTYAPVRDNARRHHPCIVPWEALSEAEKQKDRDTVLNMPAFIKKAGFQIRRRV